MTNSNDQAATPGESGAPLKAARPQHAKAAKKARTIRKPTPDTSGAEKVPLRHRQEALHCFGKLERSLLKLRIVDSTGPYMDAVLKAIEEA